MRKQLLSIHNRSFFYHPSANEKTVPGHSCTTIPLFIIHQPMRKQLLSIHNRSSLYHPSANEKTAAEHSQPFVPLSSVSQ
jgi:hypothetical protein